MQEKDVGSNAEKSKVLVYGVEVTECVVNRITNGLAMDVMEHLEEKLCIPALRS